MKLDIIKPHCSQKTIHHTRNPYDMHYVASIRYRCAPWHIYFPVSKDKKLQLIYRYGYRARSDLVGVPRCCCIP